MSYYEPDNWIIVKIDHPQETVYKVLAGWSGGYLYGNSWRMNSGIVRAEFDGKNYSFYGNSGSQYRCHAQTEGLRMATVDIFNNLVELGAKENITVQQVNAESLPNLQMVIGKNND